MSPAGIFCLLLMVAATAAQTGGATAERALPQWLTGIIAVTGFLFLTFVAMLVNRAWCGESSSKDAEAGMAMDAALYDTSLDTPRRKGSDTAYDNTAYDNTAYDNTAYDNTAYDNTAYDNMAFSRGNERMTAM